MNALPPPPRATGRDRTTLWGVLGIVFGLICCGILGILFGYFSVRDARKFGQSPLLGYLAIAFGVINILGSGILSLTGNYPVWND